LDLAGKSAVVTGSSRGIGAAIAKLFAEKGASVVVNSHKDEQENLAVVKEIRESGGHAESCIADVRSTADAERLSKSAIDAFGKIDILVNNAGIANDSLMENMSYDSWQDVLDTNLTGVFNCSKAVFSHMKLRGKGRIINISSIVAEMGNIGQVNYAASKGGVISLTKAMALECARYGILVNAIAPGFCATRMTSSIPPQIKEKILSRIPLKRFGFPEEIAYVALFLASDRCGYMTGQVLSVNGGLHL
jgi:3-oxoacyl-[acyl-carrier protein] reductase